MSFYLDASFVVSAFTNEPKSSVMQAWLRGQPQDDVSLSSWTLTEAASALSKKVRDGTMPLTEYHVASNVIRALTNNYARIPISEDHFLTARHFINRHETKLRAGDSLHLAIAADYQQCVVTLDLKMADAARILNLDVLLF